MAKPKNYRVLCLTCGMVALEGAKPEEINSALALCPHVGCQTRQLHVEKFEELPADLGPQSALTGVGAAAEAASAAYTGDGPEEGEAGDTQVG